MRIIFWSCEAKLTRLLLLSWMRSWNRLGWIVESNGSFCVKLLSFTSEFSSLREITGTLFVIYFWEILTELSDSTVLRRRRCRLIDLVVLISESLNDRFVKLSISCSHSIYQLGADTSVSLYEPPQRYLQAEFFWREHFVWHHKKLISA